MIKIDKEILTKAVKHFEKLTGLALEIKWDAGLPGNRAVDAKIRILKLKTNLYAAIKLNLTNQVLGVVAHQIKEITKSEQTIIIARYVTPQIADKLMHLNLQFLDTAGNAFINLPNLFLYIKGNKVTEQQIKEKPIRVFQPAGLKLIYALICNPGLENKPYRLMAEKAQIANGAVALAIKDLKKLGFLIDMGSKGRRIIRKKELLQRWVNLYAELLRPKLIIGRYKAENILWWKQKELLNVGAQFGGETAAALFTKYLKPQNHTIYFGNNPGRLLLLLKLKNDPVGNIELLKKFWNFNNDANNNNLVHPILIYADLLATGEDRNLETAKIIYEKEVIRYLRED